MLKFQIVSSRTVEGFENEKKFVAYMVQARQATESRVLDPDPANVERRYTHFLDLYHGLKKEFPTLLSSISFPRKIVMGNFDPNLISTRCTAFESLLDLIAGESRLRDSPAAITFFQDIELNEAKQLINEGKFDQALSVLETSFKLLNKVYTDRSRVVLGALCRIVACAGASDGTLAGPVERWAQLALKRYEAVSDSDLLLIYIPLIHTCISIWLDDMVEKVITVSQATESTMEVERERQANAVRVCVDLLDASAEHYENLVLLRDELRKREKLKKQQPPAIEPSSASTYQ